MVSISEVKEKLVCRDRTYSNILSWIENPEMVIRLANVEAGKIVSFTVPDVLDKDGHLIVKGGLSFKVESAEKYSNISDLLEKKLGITNYGNFLNYFSRYVRVWCNKSGIDLENSDTNKEAVNSFPVDIDTFLWVCTLSNKEYNIDQLMADLVAGRDRFFGDYAISSISIDENIMKRVLDTFPDKLKEYKGGKVGIGNLFFGEYMKLLPDKNIDKAFLRTEVIAYIDRI